MLIKFFQHMIPFLRPETPQDTSKSVYCSYSDNDNDNEPLSADPAEEAFEEVEFIDEYGSALKKRNRFQMAAVTARAKGRKLEEGMIIMEHALHTRHTTSGHGHADKVSHSRNHGNGGGHGHGH